jgi:hypothetical protein
MGNYQKGNREAAICPQCGSHSIALYLYGLPLSTEKLQPLIDIGKIILGGCCITDKNPVHHCNECMKDF